MLIEEKIVGEVKTAISDMLEKIIKVADRHGEDRDELLARVGIVVQNMIDMATFKEYRIASKKAPTRIENFRSMSVEELADEILKRGEISTVIDFCQNFGDCCETIAEEECRKCLINWLNAPVEQKKAIPTEHFETRFNTVV